jgi:hypothetical protein
MPSLSERDARYFASPHAPPPGETVILVHGTWANSASASPPWWDPSSEFVKNLDAALAARGSIARCWAPQPFEIERPKVFAWSGENSQSKRQAASVALAELLSWWEGTENFRYHIVAHSHGGNVVLGALDELARDPRRLGAVVFLGTPVLRFSRAPRVSFHVKRYGPGAVMATFLASSLWLAIAAGGMVRLMAMIVGVVLVLTLFLEFGGLAINDPLPKRRRSSRYGSGQPYAYVFDSDEAIAGLSRTIQAMAKPRDLIQQLMASRPGRRYVLEPWAPNDEIRLLNTWPTLTLKGMRDTWGGRTRNSPRELVFMSVLVIASVIGVVPYLVIYTWQILAKLRLSLAARFKRWLLEYPGARIMGRVIKGAAVGADQGQFECLARLPPIVESAEVISDELQTKMRSTTRAALAQLGELLGARVFGLSYEDLLATADDSGGSVQLAHSQYYREREIIEGIAKHIYAHGWGDIPQFPRPGSTPSQQRAGDAAGGGDL